jgi:hypothetical protein
MPDPTPTNEEMALAVESLMSLPPWPVTVHIAQYVMPQRSIPESPLDRKRAAIWQNENRNQALAALARGFAAGDCSALWKCGLLQDDNNQCAGPLLPSLPTVVVIVESIEHAAELAKLLPEFGVVAARAIVAGSAAPRRMAIHWIMTLVAAHQAERIPAEVVINAVGGPHALDLPNWTAAAQGRGHVVDLTDEWDDQAEYDTQVRLIAYSRRMAKLVGATGVLGRDPSTPMTLPRKDRQQRLEERLAGIEPARRKTRLDKFRRWRDQRVSNS